MRRPGAGVITFNHDSKRNALSRALIDELIATLDEIRAAGARSVILRAHPGVKVWSAGHDVAELPGPGRDPLGYDDPLRRLVRAIETLPLPVIAMIEGSVWGGACELAITCDLVIATPEATFALTPARLGVPYNTAGILNMMNSISTRLLKEMLFTARPISSERALHLGMINSVVPGPDIERFTLQLAAQLAETSPLCVALMKEELRVLLGVPSHERRRPSNGFKVCAGRSTTAMTTRKASARSSRSASLDSRRLERAP